MARSPPARAWNRTCNWRVAMSSSSRRHRRAAWTAAAAGAAAAALATAAGAADVYYQPIVTLSSAYNTNIDLDPVTRTRAVGYFADAATNIGIATPQSETNLQPPPL